MKKIINILIFNVVLAVSVAAGTIRISNDNATDLYIAASKPSVVDFNFIVKKAKLVQAFSDASSLELLDKGFILIPKKSVIAATVVVTAMDGTTYVLNMQTRRERVKSVFHLEDPMQGYKSKAQKNLRFETDKIDTDARNIVKAILLDKPLSGFEKVKAERSVSGTDIDMRRKNRYVGSKYVADRWEITNKTGKVLYFSGEDFYTKGVLAVSLQKKRIQPGESVFMITLLNKYSVYLSEKEGS